MGAYQTFLYRKERNEALSGSVVAREIGLFKGLVSDSEAFLLCFVCKRYLHYQQN